MGRFGRFVSLLILIIVVADRRIVYADDSVRLMVGRSTVVNVGTPIARVSLTTADIADALVTSPSELLINGKMPGTISMFVWDRAGGIKKYEVIVQRDLARLSEQIEQLFPGEKIEVRSNGKDIVLAGTVRDKAVMEKAVNLAAGYVDKKEEVVNLLALQAGAPSNQVLLKVRFAEVSRSALTELGASFFTSANGFHDVLGRVGTNQFPGPTFDNSGSQNKLVFSDFLNFFVLDVKNDLGLVIKALQTRGLLQSLAEPNLVAESGKEASFLAGGEIPIPIAQPGQGGISVTVQYKEFGIRLNFTPIVNGDRVHLHVKPEVSSLDYNNAVLLQGFRIPALTTRRTETELELMNGQTFAIAGLINNQMNKTLQKVPGIGDIPILGLLFQSQAAQKDRTELVVMITPVILPNNSPGVTPTMPNIQEPYLPTFPPKKGVDTPPPSFTQPRGSAAIAPAPTPAPTVAPTPVPTAPTPTAQTDHAAAARTVQALTPNARPITSGDALPAKPIETPAAQPARQLTPQEQKAFDRARQQEAEIAKKAQTEQAKRDGEAARRAMEEAKRQEQINKAAQESAAKRNAEIAKKQAELAKKQAEDDKKKEKEVAEAEKKLKAAQAAYEAEVAKTKKPSQQQQQ